MEPQYSIDLISDLDLRKTEQFDWTGKPTSLFCVVAGGISSNLDTVKNTLEHLGGVYRGVLYIDGKTEHTNPRDHAARTDQLAEICRPLTNVVYMHNYVVVLNNIAFVAANGWYNSGYTGLMSLEDGLMFSSIQKEEVGYLGNSIRSLQSVADAKKIVVVTGSVPADVFLFQGWHSDYAGIEPGLALAMDSGKKVSHWLYGGKHPQCDITYNDRRYITNPRVTGQPYWPKKVDL